MKILKITINFLFLFLIISCDQKQDTTHENDDSLIKIPVDVNINNNFSNHLEISRIVLLETNKNSLIKRIYKLRIANDNILVFDKSLNKIFSFKNTGSFIKQIGSFGRGPKEYSAIMDFTSSLDNTIISIYDSNAHKIIIHNSLTDEIKEINVNSYYSNLEIWNNKHLVLFNQLVFDIPVKTKIPNFQVTNFNGKSVYEDIYYNSTEKTQTKFLRKHDLCLLEDGAINLQRYLNDTMYIYNGKNLRKRFYFDFGDYALPKKIKLELMAQANGNIEKFQNSLNKTKYLNNLNAIWLENKDFIFTSRESGKPELLYVLINKKSYKPLVFNFVKQDFIYKFLQIPHALINKNGSNFLVFSVTPNNILKLKTQFKIEFDSFKEEYPNQGELFEQAIDMVKFEDNPVLIYAKLKF